MKNNMISFSSNKRVKKIGSAKNQITNKIIIKGNSLFQKGNTLNYSETYVDGYVLRSVGDLDDNNITIKVSNIPVINIGDVVISYDDNTSRLISIENLERFRNGINYYIYGENNNNIKFVVNYEQGNEDYYGITNNFKMRDASNFNLSSVRVYCDGQYYGTGLKANADNIFFKDITTNEDDSNTNIITVKVFSSLKRIGDIYDSLNLENGVLIRKIGSRAYKSGDENDTTVLTDFTTTLYILESPTQEIIDVSCLNIKLLENGYLWLNNNIIPEVDMEYIDTTIENYGPYFNILFNGAVGDGVEDDSKAFNKDFNYVPEGYIFKIDKKTALRLNKSNIIGKGKIVIKDFPYDPRKNQKQGIFIAENITDEFKMCMNLPNEAIPNGAQMRQKVSGWFPFEDAEIPMGYEVINTWGQVFIIQDESYPNKAVIHIANLTLLGYRESTKSWEILNNPDNIGGGLFFEDYHDNTFVKADSFVKNHVYNVNIDKSYSGRLLHLWSNQCYIKDLNTDFKYICAYMDAWVTGDNNTTLNSDVINKFVMNVGSDDRLGYDGTVREMCGGRFIKLTNIPRRCYATNLNAEIIDEYATQKLIDDISCTPAKYYGRTHDAPIAPMPGEYYFDYQKNKVLFWDGTTWKDSMGN